MRTLLEDLKMASEFQEQKIKRELLNCNLLIIDDYMLSAIDETETALLYELIHDRELSDRTSTILCTQYDLKGCAMEMKGQTMTIPYDSTNRVLNIVEASLSRLGIEMPGF